MDPGVIFLIVIVVMAIVEAVLFNFLVGNFHPLAGFKGIGLGLGVLLIVVIAVLVTSDSGTSVHPAIMAAAGLIVYAGIGYVVHLYLKLRG